MSPSDQSKEDRGPLLDVLGRRPSGRRPVWFMRQAGRYLPEYRAVRERAGSFLDLCYDPDLASEVTLQPLRRFDLDAAILFADILVVPHAMGVDVRFEEGEGPVLAVVRSGEDVRKLGPVRETEKVRRVCETVSNVRARLAGDKALIGFCGAPWTVASYMLQGGGSDRTVAKISAYRREPWFMELMDRLVEESVEYLSAQVEAGVDAVQIFDSWAGDLVGEEREAFVMEPLAEMASRLEERYPGIPVIIFARGVGQDHIRLGRSKGVAAIGIETECDLGRLPGDLVVQGNLDPVALLAGTDVACRETKRICGTIGRERHIFNLGHGIRVGTDPEVIRAVVDTIRQLDG